MSNRNMKIKYDLEDGFFYQLDYEKDFDTFFDDFVVLWEEDWVRSRKYIEQDLYRVRGNKEAWRKYYKDNEYKFLILNNNISDVGYVAYKNKGNELYIGMFLIGLAWRGKGYGGKMLRQFIDLMKKNSTFEIIRLDTNEKNLANRIYEKSGFTVEKIKENDRENGESTLCYIYHRV